jgi:hypothetical protein
MKRCPRCNTLYEDSIRYCLNDGSPLVEGSFSLPSDDEQETVVRHGPIAVDVMPPGPAPTAPDPGVEAGKPKRRGGFGFLLAGLFIGGGLVLIATLLVGIAVQLKEESANNKPVSTPTPTPKPTPTPTKTPDVALERHAKPNPNVDPYTLNGRVIMLNAYVHSAPSSDSPIVDTLPIDDRLNIGERAGPNSPWFEVVCEHGTSGWMHGNTIEFTDEE